MSVAFRENADIDVILSTEGRHRDQLEGRFTLFTSDYELEPAFLGKNMSKMAKFNALVLDQVEILLAFPNALNLGVIGAQNALENAAITRIIRL